MSRCNSCLNDLNSQSSTIERRISESFYESIALFAKNRACQVAPEVQNEIEESELKAVFSLRKIKGQVDLQVDFTMENRFQVMKNITICQKIIEILRDFQQEAHELSDIETFGYQASTKNWQKAYLRGTTLYLFTREIPVLRQLGEVRIGKKLRELYLDAQHHRPEIVIEENGSWLDIKFDVSGIQESEIIMRSCAACLQSAQFYTTENGQVLSLESEEFQEASAALKIASFTRSEGWGDPSSFESRAAPARQFADQASFSAGFSK